MVIAGKERVQQPPGLAVTMNVDGFGNQADKIAKYQEFTRAPEARRFEEVNEAFFRANRKTVRIQALNSPLMETLAGVGLALGLLLGVGCALLIEFLDREVTTERAKRRLAMMKGAADRGACLPE